MKRKKISLKNGLLSMIVFCWLIPIILVISLAGFLLGKSYQESSEQMLAASANYAAQQVHRQLKAITNESKSVSYDGVVRTAYQNYLERGDSAELYKKVDDYLTQKFARNDHYRAAFICFWDQEADTKVYLLNSGITGFGLLQACKEASAEILLAMEDVETEIQIMELDGNLYAARNLLDSHFKPYATLGLLLNSQEIFAPLDTLNQVEGGQICLDDVTFLLGESGRVLLQEFAPAENADIQYCREQDGHRFCFTADFMEYHLFEENPKLLWLAAAVALMVLPILIVVIALFQRHLSRPMKVLVDANKRMESGQRGCEITEPSPNAEFENLYQHFNTMSKELKNQFERSYLEQQAAQKAQIKALQSQINPHFLNNTLEVINWEARLSGNDQISNMIEALSTMLGAALDRKGSPQITLKEEMEYVDAYLKISQWRIGENFHVFKEMDPQVMMVAVPRLILQPIVENAVEHDIARHSGGSLWIRAFRTPEYLVIEVEHDGSLSPEDQENVRKLLSGDAVGSHVGLQNVAQRMKLIYGSTELIQVENTDHATITARLQFPQENQEGSLP